jgi:hypothetical protein
VTRAAHALSRALRRVRAISKVNAHPAATDAAERLLERWASNERSYTMSIAMERAKAGMAWLDENRPGWRDLVNPYTIRMEDSCGCIWGQIEGNFWRAFDAPDVLRAAGTDSDGDSPIESWMIEHGFNYGDSDCRFSDLNAAWRELLRG